MEDQILTPTNGWDGSKETEASCSIPSHSPSQFPARRLQPATLRLSIVWKSKLPWPKREELPHLPHAWQVSMVEDMFHDSKAGLTEVILMGLGCAVLFYERQSLGEGLSLGEAWDIMFPLSGGSVGLASMLSLMLMHYTCGEGWQLITQAMTKWCAQARRPGHPHSCLSASLLFRFCSYDGPPWEERLQSADEPMEEPRHIHWALHHDWDWESQHSQDCGQRWWDPLVAPIPTPSPSLECGFKSDRSSVSSSSLVSLHSNRFGTSGIHTMAEATGSPEAIWRLICQSSRMRTRKMPSLIKVGIGI